jgi:hypothetical protein
MSLSRFIYTKEILIDDAGWGDLILGTVIGALKLPDQKYMVRRIPLIAFKSPNFENKLYLNEALRIVKEILEAMQVDKETCLKFCSGYILSRVSKYLQDRGFHVERINIFGELQKKIERSYIEWCIEVGVPEEILTIEKRFYPILEWVAEKFELRENLVKTGWKSWKNKWRNHANEIHLKKMEKLREKYFG